MTSKQESKFGMYLATSGFCDANASFTTALPNFTANLTALKSTCTQLQSIAEQQKISKTGITANKNQLRRQLVVMAGDNARKLKAYGKFTNNQTLIGEIDFSESDFKKASDTALKDLAQIVYDRAQSNVASLASYGISTITQTALLAAINGYNATLAAPRIGITVTSQATKQLSALFATADGLLASMDAAVEIIRLTQVNFYNGYKSARKIIRTAGAGLAVKGVVMDTVTGAGLKGATVTLTPTASPSLMKAASSPSANVKVATHSKKTADKGGFRIKSLAEGTYEMTVSKVGYATQTLTVNVNDGEMTTVDVALEK